MTDLHRNSKADTVLLLLDTEADLFTDLSQVGVALVDEGTYLAEEPSARAAIAGDRDLALVVDIGPDSTGTLLYHGHASGDPYTYRVVVVDDFGPKVQVYEDGELLVTVAVPDLDSEPGPYLVHWASKSTGTDTARSEVLVVNLTSGADAHGFDDHATGTPNAAHALYVGAVDGANGYSEGLSAIHSVRIGTAFHSLVEACEDWIDESTAPSVASETRLEPVPVDSNTDAAAEGVLYGPGILHPAHASTQADKRLWSPIVNEVYRQASGAPSLTYELEPVRHAAKAPKSDYLHLLLRHTWRRPVPPGCRRAHARVHVTMWPTAGADVCPVQFQVWSFDVLPYTYKGVGPAPKSSATSIVSRSTSDSTSTGAGAWVDLGNLFLLERDGLTWLSLGVGFAEGDSDPALEETLVRINAIQIEPTYPTPDAGFDLEEP